MFIYCFDDDLRNRLILDHHRLLYEGKNEKGCYWVFSMTGTFEFSQKDKENESYVISKRLIV